jgi:hypothetical protein
MKQLNLVEVFRVDRIERAPHVLSLDVRVARGNEKEWHHAFRALGDGLVDELRGQLRDGPNEARISIIAVRPHRTKGAINSIKNMPGGMQVALARPWASGIADFFHPFLLGRPADVDHMDVDLHVFPRPYTDAGLTLHVDDVAPPMTVMQLREMLKKLGS